MTKEIKITCKAADGMALDELYEFQGELKTISDDELEKLKKSIVKYGFSFPIFVWKSKILDGHQRLKAVRQLIEQGYKVKGNKLPVVRIEAKNEKEAAEKLLLINSRYAKIDEGGFQVFTSEFDLDLNEMTELIELPEINFSFGQDEDYRGLTDPDEVPEVEETPVSKTGDIWLLGDHRLMCGDSTEEDDVQRLMNGEKAVLMQTDPPYGVGRDEGFGGFGGFGKPIARRQYKDAWDKERPDKRTFDIIINFSKKHIIWGGNFFADILPQSTHWIVWDKKQTMPTFGDCEIAWTSIDRKSVKKYEVVYNGLIGKEKERYHPTQKPIKLFESILIDYSEDNDIIFDPFSGSGTTIIAAEQTGRRCYAMEISPQYVDVAVKRWQDFIGKDAVLESNSKNFNTVSSSLVIVT
jgi:DNA modification methylase